MGSARIDPTGVIVTCASCARPNRLSFAMLGKTSRCGQCKAPVPPPAAPIDVNDAASFDALSATSAIPLIVDFWAPWCGPCRMVAPELERVARESSGRHLVVKVNTDEVAAVASRFRISSIPTLAVVHRGRELESDGRSSNRRPRSSTSFNAP